MTFSQTKYVFTVGVHLNTLGKNSPTYKNDNKNALGARDYKPIISCLRDIHNVFFLRRKSLILGVAICYWSLSLEFPSWMRC